MEDLIEQNMGLVLTVVNRFHPKDQNEKEAYIQAGRIGLWKAINKFSETGGSKFSPYAWNPIKWEIIKEIRAIKGKAHIEFVEGYQTFDKADTYTTNGDSKDSINLWELLPTTLTKTEESVILLKSQGYNFKEISNLLSLDRTNTKKTFDSAANKIRENNDG